MPTGYTADVANGKVTELEPFILQCARGMGALITMRDDPWDAPIPERLAPSDYHSKKLSELRAERDRLRAISPSESQALADAALAKFENDRLNAEQEHTERRNRYSAMIAKVIAWDGAPEGIKEFALDQLRQSREFDCSEPFEFYRSAPERDGKIWIAGELLRIEREIEYHAAEDGKERARTDARNAWLAQLRSSLKSNETASAE